MYEEDVEKAMETCVAIMGPCGTIIYPTKLAKCNAKVYAPECGYLWYGDVPASDILFYEKHLTSAIGYTVEIVDQDHHL